MNCDDTAGCKILSGISFKSLLSSENPQESGADVVLHMGPNREPIYAHSIFLKNASDYYQTALSSRWKGEAGCKPGIENANESGTEISATSTPSSESNWSLVNHMMEIHHPDYEKRHMIHVLNYIYGVTTYIPVEDLLAVALMADHLLMNGLKEKCVSCIVTSAIDLHRYAFRLFSLAANDFSSNEKLMQLSLEIVYKSFGLAICEISDVAALTKYEIQSLIVDLPLSPLKKWILLIVWAMASYEMIEKDRCDDLRGYIFTKMLWKDKMNESFQKAVLELLHLIPLTRLRTAELHYYVQPFVERVVLNADLQDYLTSWFKVNENRAPDECVSLCRRIRNNQPLFMLLPNCNIQCSLDLLEFVYEKVFSSRSKLLARHTIPYACDTVNQEGVSQGLKVPIKEFPNESVEMCVHLLETERRVQQLVVVFARGDGSSKFMDYLKWNGNEMGTWVSPHGSQTEKCSQHEHHSNWQHNAECRKCPAYLESVKGQVRLPSRFQGQKIQNYQIFYF